ncbi:MAG: septal ring lytic transglycosylase RlpA family protein, partial [Terracidiphilus sp.]
MVPGRSTLRGAACGAALAIALVAVSGCHHEENTRVAPQALPPRVQPAPAGQAAQGSARIDATPLPPGGISDYDLAFIAAHQPILSEIGYATWYSAPYKGRRSANGQVFDNNALTAAQRTLPMGSLIVVTNLKTGQSSAMRISDRGPFVGDRMIDLTIASAKAVGIYPGSGQV